MGHEERAKRPGREPLPEAKPKDAEPAKLLSDVSDTARRFAETAKTAAADLEQLAKAIKRIEPLIPFIPIGKWALLMQKETSAEFIMDLRADGTFRAFEKMWRNQPLVEGVWAFYSNRNLLTLAGNVTRYKTFSLHLTFTGHSDGVFAALGSDGIAYFLKSAEEDE